MNRRWRTGEGVRVGVLAWALMGLFFSLLGCGYHTVGGKSTQLPSDLHTIAIPTFTNATRQYRVEQVLTEAVVREFLARTQYRVVNRDNGTADAVLNGTVTWAGISPITWDSVTGRVSTARIEISMRVSLVDRHGKTLYTNPAYSFREHYEIATEPSAYFQEATPALDRLAREFAHALVSNVLEAY